MRHSICLVTIILLLTIFVNHYSLAQRLCEGSLRGLTTVAVVVLIDEKHHESTLNLKESLATAVELKLRQSGIKIREKASTIFSIEIIILDVPIEGDKNYHSYAIDLSVIERINFKRNGLTVYSPHSKVWYRGPTAGVESNYSELKAYILDGVDAFLNDWHADNLH